MNGYTLNGAPWFESLPDFKLLLNIKWNSYIRPTAKEHIKKHGWFLVPLQKVSNHSCIFYLYKTRIRPKMNVIYWLKRLKPYVSALVEFRSIYLALWVMDYSPPYYPFHRDEKSKTPLYCICIYMANLLSSYIP